MFNVISKPSDQIGVSDIEALIASRVPEGEQLEFKESLSGKSNSPDPWIDGEDRIGTRARNKVLEEAVAFANAYGGALLIGVRESATKPPVAVEIRPLPRCAELAERLRHMFRDCVEPQIPKLEVFDVPIEGESGVVAIRVGRSHLAPHRVTPTRVCPVRRADRRDELTMREIQEMTLNVSRGMERFERRLVKRSERFQREFDRLDTPADSYGLRFTALPVGEDVQFDRVFSEDSIIDELSPAWRTVTKKTRDGSQQLENLPEFPPNFWRPILRGARADNHPSSNSVPQYIGYRELYCDGLLEVGFAERAQASVPLDPDIPLIMFANTVVWANHVKSQSSAPMAEWGLEVEMRIAGNPVRVGKRTGRMFAKMTENVVFPKYSLSDEEAPAKLLSIFNRDFWNWLGQDVHSEEDAFEIGGITGHGEFWPESHGAS